MTWHLKDRELEKKLIKTCPNFIECIEDAIQTKEKDTNYIYVEFDREREGDTLGFNYLYFWDDELEEVPEYNPKDGVYLVTMRVWDATYEDYFEGVGFFYFMNTDFLEDAIHEVIAWAEKPEPYRPELENE